MAEGKFISYLRVSTEKQGRSGLGLEAQRQAVEDFLNGGSWELIEEYRETESGRRNDRPELAKALAHCRRVGAALVIAKLDRLARNVAFVANLMESGVDFVACDFPQANRLTVHVLAAVAEHEARMASERTKAALGHVKRVIETNGSYTSRAGNRLTKLGNPAGAAVLLAHVAEHGNARAVAALQAGAAKRAEDYRAILETLLAGGLSNTAIAHHLNDHLILTPRNGLWTATSVRRLRERLGA